MRAPMSRMAHLPTLLLILGLAACGGGDAGGGGDGPARVTPASIIASAITANREVKSYRMDLEMAVNMGPRKEHFEMKGTGVSSADSYRGTFEGTMKLPKEGTTKVKFIIVDREMWMRTPDLAKVAPKGKEWMHLKDDQMVSRTMTPAEYLDFIKDSDGVREVGREDVRGNPSIHLRGPIDLRELANKTSSEAAQMLSRLPSIDRYRAEIDVWVSERDDRMTRSAMKVTSKDVKGTVTFSSDILEWDPSLKEAKAPPKAKVVELSELGKG